MRVVISVAAETDLEGIADYIARDNPRRALSYVGEIRAYCHSLGISPRAYAAVDELSAGLRRALYGRYMIFFSVRDILSISSAFCTAPARSARICLRSSGLREPMWLNRPICKTASSSAR
jgi:toxin ParE1/3/4